MSMPSPEQQPEQQPDLPVLAAELVEEITALLDEHGGALPLGHVTQKFMGVKRAQLEEIFEMARVGDHGQWEVRLPGVTSDPAEMMFEGKAVSSDTPLPPLTIEQIVAITKAIEDAPTRSLPISMVTKVCPGVKRKQLTDHFMVMRGMNRKSLTVTLASGPRSHPPGAPQAPQAPPWRHPAPIGSSPRMPLAFPARAFQSPRGLSSARPPTQFHPGFPPPPPQAPDGEIVELPPLDTETLAQVAELLEEQGGSASLGKVSSRFKFVKRQQLEGFFGLEREGDQWIVRLQDPERPSFLRGEMEPGGGATVQVVELPPLDGETVAQVAALLAEEGGSASLGKVSSRFKFVKRQQLEGHFGLERGGDQWVVRLLDSSGLPAQGDAEAGKKIHVKATVKPEPEAAFPRLPLRFMQPTPQARPPSAPPPGKGGVVLAGMRRMPQTPVGGRAAPLQQGPAVPLVRLRQMGPPNFAIGAPAASPAQRRPLVLGWGAPAVAGVRPATRPHGSVSGVIGAVPGAAAEVADPPPPLGAEVVQQITALLQEAGGTVNMGRISQVFMGVKRAQLEDHFDLAREESQWRVSLRSSPAPAAKRRRVEAARQQPASMGLQ